MPNSWEVSGALEPIRLIPADQPYSLSELDIAPEAFDKCAAGWTLGVMHAHGMTHLDLHRDHLFFNFASGRTIVIDASGDLGETSASRMYEDFVTPFVNLERGEFFALLSGYIQCARLVIDERCPGFTAELLRLIGGQPDLPQLTRRPDFWITAVDTLGLSLHHYQSRIEVSVQRPHLDAGMLTPEAAALPACLALCGADPSLLLSVLRSVDPLQHSAPHTTGLLRLSSKFVNALSAVPPNERALSPESLSCLRAATGPLDTAEARSFVRLLGHGLAYLARGHDTNPDQRRSASSIAQFSVLMQKPLLGSDIQLDEVICLEVGADYYGTGWASLTPGPDEHGADPLTGVALAAYRNTVASVFHNAFAASARTEGRNPLWSWLWQAMRINRRSLLALMQMSTQAFDAQAAQNVALAATAAAMQQYRCLTSILTLTPVHLMSWEQHVDRLSQHRSDSHLYSIYGELDKLASFLKVTQTKPGHVDWGTIAGLDSMYDAWRLIDLRST